MRTLLRHAATGRYYQSLGRWTVDPENAHDFGSITRAVSFAHKARLTDMEVALSFEHPEQATNVSLQDLVLNS